MNNLTILIESMTNTAKAPSALGVAGQSPLRSITNATLGNLIAHARSKLSRPELTLLTDDPCHVSSDIFHLEQAIKRAEAVSVRDDPTCIQQGTVGHSILLLSEQLEVKMSTICAIKCIKMIEDILNERDMGRLQTAVTESVKPIQSLVLEIKPLIESFKNKDPSNIFSTELSDCMRALSESIVVFFTAVQSMVTRGGSPSRSDRRACESVIKVLDRIIVTCSAVYSVNMHMIKSVDPEAAAGYADTLRTPLEEKLVNKIVDLRLRLDDMYQSILSWSNCTDPNGSIDDHGENVRSIVDDINGALDIARKLSVFDESPVKKLLTEFACKDIGDYTLKMLTELRVIAKEVPATKEARNSAVTHKFRLFYVMTRQSVDVLHAAVVLDGAAAAAGLGCYARLVNTGVTELAKLTEAQPVSADAIKEALINSEMYFSKYIAILEALTSSTPNSTIFAAPTAALKAAIELLKGQRAALAAAAKRALATQQAAPAGSLTQTLMEEISASNDVIITLDVRAAAYLSDFERDAEYLFAYLQNSGATGIRTRHPNLLTDYVRSLLLTLQGLQGLIKKFAPEFPSCAQAEEKCRAFAPHMQALVALARNPAATQGDVAAARASVTSITKDVAEVAACVAQPSAALTISDLKMPAAVKDEVKKWGDDVRAKNARMTFAAVPTGPNVGYTFNCTIAELAHMVEESLGSLRTERVGQVGRQMVAIARELGKSVAMMALSAVKAEIVMAAAEGVKLTCESIIKTGVKAANVFKRSYKFGYTGLMMININCVMCMTAFKVCAPAYALNKKDNKAKIEGALKGLVANIIDLVSAVVSYEI